MNFSSTSDFSYSNYDFILITRLEGLERTLLHRKRGDLRRTSQRELLHTKVARACGSPDPGDLRPRQFPPQKSYSKLH